MFKKKICQNCNDKIKASDNFCSNCGFPIKNQTNNWGMLGKKDTKNEKMPKIFSGIGGNMMNKMLGNAIGMPLVRSYERSERVYNAMVARGYSGRIKTLRRFKMTSLDWLKAAFIVAIALLLHIVNMIDLLSSGVY